MKIIRILGLQLFISYSVPETVLLDIDAPIVHVTYNGHNDIVGSRFFLRIGQCSCD